MRVEALHGVEFIRLPKAVTLSNALEVRALYRGLVGSRPLRIAFDLTSVGLMDSSGLAALLTCVEAARAKGGDAVLINPTPRVRALIELTRVNDVVPVVQDDEGARMLLNSLTPAN